MNDEENESPNKSKIYDTSFMDGINSFTNSSISSDDEVKSKKYFDVKTYLKNELDLLLKVLRFFLNHHNHN